MIKRIVIVSILSAFILSACATKESVVAVELPANLKDGTIVMESANDLSLDKQEDESVQANQFESSKEPSFAQNLALQTVKSLAVSFEDGETAIRKIYLYLIQNIFFADPVGLDSWRYLSDEPNVPIPYIENRALSPLLFQIGSCEDFAAVAVMLLRAAGFEADYVAGFTVSVKGDYIDHAWAVVNLEDNWYHIDPQLEQNVVRNFKTTYRYYLKSDAAMLADHRWGENLIRFWSMPEEEKENIRRYHIPPACPESYPSLPSEPMLLPKVPNEEDVNARVRQIKEESGRGNLPSILLNVEPPVLVREHHITPPLLPD